MLHLDEEAIAGAAMGESLSDADALHLTQCERCAEQVRAYERLMDQATSMARPQPLVAPPARVWDAISAEVGLEGAEPAVGTAHAESDSRAAAASAGKLATVTPMRRFSGWLVAAAAAVGLVVGGVGVNALSGIGGGESTVVASAPLTTLATDASAGTARVELRPDGEKVLVVDTEFRAVSGGDLEVWLIDPNIEGMVSLGFLASDHGEFVIPEGYDPSAYPIVDISIEPRDGVPTHSGDSVTRGILGV